VSAIEILSLPSDYRNAENKEVISVYICDHERAIFLFPILYHLVSGCREQPIVYAIASWHPTTPLLRMAHDIADQLS
jgi:hypothetical protein